MKESPEVILYKQEVAILKRRIKNNSKASSKNIYKNWYGTPIYNNINSSEKNRNVPRKSSIDMQEVSKSINNTYDLNISYGEIANKTDKTNNILYRVKTFKSHNDRIKLTKGFLENIYNYYRQNPNEYKLWTWNGDVYDDDTPPLYIFENFHSAEKFYNMILKDKFDYKNDTTISLYLINIQKYHDGTNNESL